MFYEICIVYASIHVFIYLCWLPGVDFNIGWWFVHPRKHFRLRLLPKVQIHLKARYRGSINKLQRCKAMD